MMNNNVINRHTAQTVYNSRDIVKFRASWKCNPIHRLDSVHVTYFFFLFFIFFYFYLFL